jgi:hypothetical protein
MLLFGIRIKSGKEILGQIPRLLVGGVKSFVGKIPVGNTGGANVPPMKPMEIPADLALMLANFAKAVTLYHEPLHQKHGLSALYQSGGTTHQRYTGGHCVCRLGK